MSNVSELKLAAGEYYKAKQRVDEALKKDGPSAVAREFQDILKDCPQVVVFWRQGTPAFNDGDPCRFRVHDMWICPVDSDYGEESALNDDGAEPDSDSNEPLITPEQYQKIYDVWGSLDKYILEMAFDEAKVTITADSVTVDDFDWYD